MKQIGDWNDVYKVTGSTVGKDLSGFPTHEWRRKMMVALHSPIRVIRFRWTWIELPYFVSVHLVRHNVGTLHFVSTQRSDRTNIDRLERRQTDPVMHTMEANAESIINISRKRLCSQASEETKEAWEKVVEQLPEWLSCRCVPECLYRGFCPETFIPCGYDKTEVFEKELKVYRGL